MMDALKTLFARASLTLGLKNVRPPKVPPQKLQDISIVIRQNHDCNGNHTAPDRDTVGESKVHDMDPDKEK